MCVCERESCFVEHLECSHQSHIQGRGAKKHTAGRMIGIGLRASGKRALALEVRVRRESAWVEKFFICAAGRDRIIHELRAT